MFVLTKVPDAAVLVDPATGRLLHRAVTSYRPTAEQVAHVRAAYMHSSAPAAKCPPAAATSTTSSHTRTATPSSATSSRSTVPGTTARPDGHYASTIDDNGTCTVTTTLGQTRTVTPDDYRLRPDD